MITDVSKAYLSAISAASISESFTYNMAAKINWHRYGTIITSLSPYVYSLPAFQNAGPLIGDRHGTGSLSHRVNGSFGSSFTSGSPGHHFDPV